MSRGMRKSEAEKHAGPPDESEWKISLEEQSLDGAWQAQLRRREVLSELLTYILDREVSLSSHLDRLGINDDEFEQRAVKPSLGDLVQTQESEWLRLDQQRPQLLDARSRSCVERELAVAHYQSLLSTIAAAHAELEAALIQREQQLAGAFSRAMCERMEVLVEPSGDTGTMRQQKHPLPPPENSSIPEPLLDRPYPNSIRRRYRRVAVDAKVDFGSPHHLFPGSTSDLSAGGVFIVTDQMLQIGRTLTVNLELPQSKKLSLQGTVAWRREHANDDGPAGLGIQFTNLNDEDRAKLADFMETAKSDVSDLVE
jgi:uncharacterized protein (TIGR02266 family)